MTHIVYVVGPGDRNEELRFSLRSLAAHLPHEKVWIAGHRPDWVSDEVGHIPVAQTRTRFQNSTANMRAACEHPDVGGEAGEFVYFNDDFFVMQPLEGGVPLQHRGPLRDVIASTRSSLYRRGAQSTLLLMGRLGMEDDGELLSYELHAPLVVHKESMLKALDLGAPLPVLHKRTLYGNLIRLGGDQVPDVKVKTLDDPGPGGLFVSTTDATFAQGAVGERIRAAFPDPCRYEGDHTPPVSEPVPLAAAEPEPEHASPAEPPGAPDEPGPMRPSPRAPKADWVAYADRQDPGDHSQMTKAQLIAAYGG